MKKETRPVCPLQRIAFPHLPALSPAAACPRQNAPRSPNPRAAVLLVSIKLSKQQVQKQVDVELDHALAKHHELIVMELHLQKTMSATTLSLLQNSTQTYLQKIIEQHVCRPPRNHHATVAGLDKEHANLVARDGKVDLVPTLLGKPVQLDQYTLVGEPARRVPVAAEGGLHDHP